MRVASAGVIDRAASFIYVYMRYARDVLEPGEGFGRDSAGLAQIRARGETGFRAEPGESKKPIRDCRGKNTLKGRQTSFLVCSTPF
jgi:hypothetical protein